MGKKTIKRCIVCGTAFTCGRKQGKKTTDVTCSFDCHVVHERQRTAKNTRRWRAEHPTYYAERYQQLRAKRQAAS